VLAHRISCHLSYRFVDPHIFDADLDPDLAYAKRFGMETPCSGNVHIKNFIFVAKLWA